MKKIIVSVLIVVLAINILSVGVFASNIDSQTLMMNTIDYAKNVVFAEDEPTFGDEWYIFAMARADEESVSEILDIYYDNVVADFSEKQGLYIDSQGNESLNDYVRVALTLTAMGKDIHNFGGYDILDKITEMDFTAYEEASTSTLSYALTILDYYEDDENTNVLINSILDEIMTRHKGDTQTIGSLDNLQDYVESGFAYSPDYTSDPDSTAQAILALEPYMEENEQINVAVSNSILYLYNHISAEDSTVQFYGSASPSSTAQVIITFCGMEQGIYDLIISENGNKMIDALMLFSLEDGGFYEPYYGVEAGANYYTTGQALQALVAYDRMMDGKSGMLDFDTEISESPNETTISSQIDETSETTTTNIDEITESPNTGDENISFILVFMTSIIMAMALGVKKSKNEK